MHRGLRQKGAKLALVLGLGFTNPGMAKAEMMPTDQVLSSAGEARQNLRTLVDRDDIRHQLMALGVNPQEAQQRIASLSDSEVQSLNGQIASLPAGGDSTLTLSIGAAVIIVLLLVIFF